jgi:hypothetical protein
VKVANNKTVSFVLKDLIVIGKEFVCICTLIHFFFSDPQNLAVLIVSYKLELRQPLAFTTLEEVPSIESTSSTPSLPFTIQDAVVVSCVKPVEKATENPLSISKADEGN